MSALKQQILSVLTHEMTAIEIKRHLKVNYSEQVGLADLYVALRRMERDGLIFCRQETEQEQAERVFLYGDDALYGNDTNQPTRRIYYRRTEKPRSLLDKLAETLGSPQPS